MSETTEIRLVRWVDAAHKGGWLDPEYELEDFGVSECRIVGFVVREDDREILLAQSVDDRHGRLDAVMAVPKVAVVESIFLGTACRERWGTGDNQ